MLLEVDSKAGTEQSCTKEEGGKIRQCTNFKFVTEPPDPTNTWAGDLIIPGMTQVAEKKTLDEGVQNPVWCVKETLMIRPGHADKKINDAYYGLRMEQEYN